jgi:hypothetical protein
MQTPKDRIALAQGWPVERRLFRKKIATNLKSKYVGCSDKKE